MTHKTTSYRMTRGMAWCLVHCCKQCVLLLVSGVKFSRKLLWIPDTWWGRAGKRETGRHGCLDTSCRHLEQHISLSHLKAYFLDYQVITFPSPGWNRTVFNTAFISEQVRSLWEADSFRHCSTRTAMLFSWWSSLRGSLQSWLGL